jgi:hypothetical protein
MQSKTIESRPTDRVADDRQEGSYRSRMLQRYVEYIAKCGNPEILDIGPVLGNNVHFFLGLGAKLSLCDFTMRLDRQTQGPELAKALAILDYGEQRFDGIHVWDIPDHIETWLLADLVKKWFSLLKPGGLLMMLAGPSSIPHLSLHIESIGSDGMVQLAEVGSRKLPYFHRSNRDIEITMRPLEQHSSFLCSNGERQFLFRRV